MPSLQVSGSTPDTAMLDRGKLVEIVAGFLSAPERPAYTMNFHQLDGYLRALAAGPGIAQYAEWMPLVFADEMPNFKSQDEEATITNVLICLYTWHWQQVLEIRCDVPFVPEYSIHKDDRLDAEQWARGFMQGYIYWQDIWDQFLAENQTSSKLAVILPLSIHDEIDAILYSVSCVADAEYAIQNGSNVIELKEIFNQLPEKIVTYGRFGQMLRNMAN